MLKLMAPETGLAKAPACKASELDALLSEKPATDLEESPGPSGEAPLLTALQASDGLCAPMATARLPIAPGMAPRAVGLHSLMRSALIAPPSGPETTGH